MKRYWTLALLVAVALPACNSWNGPTISWKGKDAQQGAQPPAADPLDGPGAVSPPPPGLALSPEQRFKDIPLPVGLTEDLERSFVYQSASLQIGRMVYSSKASIQDLANFFLRECPAAQWQVANVEEAGAKTLEFRKSGKRLRVIVQEVGNVPKGRRVSITLTPDDGGASIGGNVSTGGL